jgi:hypothetical protein
MFLDGNLENSGAQSATPVDGSGTVFNLGRSGVTATPRYFKGWIDMVRVLTRAEWTASFTPQATAYDRP